MTVLKFSLAGAVALTLSLDPAAADGIGMLMRVSQLKAQGAQDNAQIEELSIRISTRAETIGPRDRAIDNFVLTPSFQSSD